MNPRVLRYRISNPPTDVRMPVTLSSGASRPGCGSVALRYWNTIAAGGVRQRIGLSIYYLTTKHCRGENVRMIPSKQPVVVEMDMGRMIRITTIRISIPRMISSMIKTLVVTYYTRYDMVVYGDPRSICPNALKSGMPVVLIPRMWRNVVLPCYVVDVRMNWPVKVFPWSLPTGLWIWPPLVMINVRS